MATKKPLLDDDEWNVDPTDPELDTDVWNLLAENLERGQEQTKIPDVLEAFEGIERDNGLKIRRPEIKWALYRLYLQGLVSFQTHSYAEYWDNNKKSLHLKGQAMPGKGGYITSVGVTDPSFFVPEQEKAADRYDWSVVPNKPAPMGLPRKKWKGTPLEWIDKGAPLTVAYGAGVDSTAMLVEFVRLGIRPELILFADVGAEKPETYAYLPVMQKYLKKHGFPPIVTVRYELTEAGKKARLTIAKDPTRKQVDPRPYTTITDNCLFNRTLPSLAYGFQSHACSSKWKVTPQVDYIEKGPYSDRAKAAWRAGLPVIRAIGFDASKGDKGRRERIPDDLHFYHWYPLQDWGWDRKRCKEEIRKSGLPVPMKSACFFCPSTHPWEINRFVLLNDPFVDKLRDIENMAKPYNQKGPNQGLWFLGDKLVGPVREAHPYKAEYWFESGKLTAKEMDYFIKVKWGGLPPYDRSTPKGRKQIGRPGTKPGRISDYVEVFKRFCKKNHKHPECSIEVLGDTFDAHLFKPNPTTPRVRLPDPYEYTSEGSPVSYHENPTYLCQDEPGSVFVRPCRNVPEGWCRRGCPRGR
jgi:hypothetical protein